MFSETSFFFFGIWTKWLFAFLNNKIVYADVWLTVLAHAGWRMSKTKCQCRQLLSSRHVRLIPQNKMKTRTRHTRKSFKRLPCFPASVGCRSPWRTFAFTLLLTSLKLTASGRRNPWPWVCLFSHFYLFFNDQSSGFFVKSFLLLPCIVRIPAG